MATKERSDDTVKEYVPAAPALLSQSRPTAMRYVPAAVALNVIESPAFCAPHIRSLLVPVKRFASLNAAPGANAARRSTDAPVTLVTLIVTVLFAAIVKS